MEYWLDGYNVIWRRRTKEVSATLEEQRVDLIRRVRLLRDPVRVYFDARRGTGAGGLSRTESPNVAVVFVREGVADDAMIEDLRRRIGREVTLVTDDRELRLRARQLGAQTVGVEKFIQHLEKTSAPLSKPDGGVPRSSSTKDTKRPSGVSKRKMDEWLDYFGIDEDFKIDDP